MRSAGIAEQAFRVIDPEHIKLAGGRAAHAIIYFALKKYYESYKQLPDDAALSIELQTFCTQYQAARPEITEEVSDLLPTFFEFRKMVTSASVNRAYGVIQHIATKFVHRPVVNEILSNALASESISGIAQKLTDIEAQIAATSGTSSESGISMMNLEDNGERVTTGVPWIDARFGGGRGLVLGSVLGILAGQGHGKTSLGIQLGVSQALLQRHALLILAEEGISRAIRRRILACATDIPTPELEAAGDDPMKAIGDRNPIAVREKLAAVDKYLHIVDLVNKPGDLDTGINEIYTLQHMGMSPTYVYVDWAGPLARKMTSTGFRGVKYKSPYDALKELAMQLAIAATRTNTIIAVSHQMSASQFKRGWYAEADQYCAMDCNTFTEMFKYVMVINPRHKDTGLSWLTIAKSRDDPLTKRIIVRLRGEVNKFFDVTNDYDPNPSKAKGFRKKASSGDKKVPTE
jgi:hypothetical protein